MNQAFSEQISRYILSEISLDDLRLWIASNIFALTRDPFSEDSEIIAVIEDAIVEVDEKGLSQESIKAILRRHLSTVHFDLTIGPRIIVGTSNQFVGFINPSLWPSPRSSEEGNVVLQVSLS